MFFSLKQPRHFIIQLMKCLGFMYCFTACQDDSLQRAKSPYEFVAPSNFPAPTYTFYNNSITEEGFKLGRKIFFDPILSIDGSISCSSCHDQTLAFADNPLHPFSIGIDGLVGTRNAPGLANLAFNREFFWDGGVTHLDFVPINAIESPVEMGEDITAVIAKIKNDAEYPALFEAAFNTTEINMPLLMDALAQFMLLMVSNNSKYDAYLKGEETLTDQELKGLQLFDQKCESCHSGILFTNQGYFNNGIDSVFSDSGRAAISANPLDIGKFKVPTLRNISVTAPYMHNARFNSLDAVLDHYANTVLPSNSLATSLVQANGDLGIPLSIEEKEAIIAFLETLTDYEFLNDPRFFKE
ncbi:MAG: Cytochrome c551 peroxidase (EC [uncultured Aureispira sp.]|uniref:Cytochrome c551 peroxidase (EC) n=1 Tax=uncultured Aureispira sp. TaxID=1331704 RepID=A0A6S6UJM0_9BACT|nr:MAG: Cytochrome c551 peroxidase (EC [uncultured Aureispira sp.]